MPKGVPNKRYTPEFKKMVVETMKKEHLSIYATMQKFGINDHKIIERWERIYLEEGPVLPALYPAIPEAAAPAKRNMTNALADRLALQGRFPSFLRKSEAIKIPNAS